MSAALDKSLDDIISSTRKAKRVINKKKPVGKGVGKAQKKPAVSFKKEKPTPKPAAPAVDLSYATKVVAHGLPRDLKQENIKDFFQSQIGGVQSVSMSYNEKGNFRGTATIVFKSNKNSVKAVEKYNNAPIDGGSSKLKMELVIDPSKKPLAARITANAETPKADQKKKLKEKLQEKKKQLQNKKAVVKAKAAQKPKAKKPEKKTAEQLDQEMSEYFQN